MQVSSFYLAYAFGLLYIIPSLAIPTLIQYPNEICFFYGMLDFIGFIPMNLLLVALFTIREVRNMSPAFYNSLDHEFGAKCLVIGMPMISLVTFFTQLVSCQHVCREEGVYILPKYYCTVCPRCLADLDIVSWDILWRWGKFSWIFCNELSFRKGIQNIHMLGLISFLDKSK